MTTYEELEWSKRCNCFTCRGYLRNIQETTAWRISAISKLEKRWARQNWRYFIDMLIESNHQSSIKHNIKRELS